MAFLLAEHYAMNDVPALRYSSLIQHLIIGKVEIEQL